MISSRFIRSFKIIVGNDVFSFTNFICVPISIFCNYFWCSNVIPIIMSESQDLEKRIGQHLKRRQETELVQIGRARTAVLPDGKLQERVYGVIGYLARYGPGVLDLLAENIAGWYATALEATRATA